MTKKHGLIICKKKINNNGMVRCNVLTTESYIFTSVLFVLLTDKLLKNKALHVISLPDRSVLFPEQFLACV